VSDSGPLLSPEARARLLDALASLRPLLAAAWPEGKSPLFSQGWVDRRRLLLVELLVQLAGEVLREDALDTRALAEKLEEVLHVAQELAPGLGLEQAAQQVLSALAEGE
jgi:hypothetical protein